MNPLLIPIVLPAVAGLLILVISEPKRYLREFITLLVSLICFGVSLILFKERIYFTLPWAGFGFEFSLRLYPFSAFILAAITGFGVLISLYSTVFMSSHAHLRWYYFYLLWRYRPM